ncbi:MAG: hypothetical protein R3324_07400, partial [Halobacteriales archaeon]|nr:hypothetical protein [Halobacteriales archaeon]
MQARSDPGLMEAIRIDLRRLHAAWMSLLYPRQQESAHNVLGPWRPKSLFGRVHYGLWGILGRIVLLIAYPLTVFGFAIRYYSRRIDSGVASLGFIGVVVLTAIVWGALTVVARFQLPYGGFLAVAAAATVATISAGLAVFFRWLDGRVVTVLFAYPFGVTAIFLPPVVAALFSPTLEDIVFAQSQSIAIYLLDFVLPGRLSAFLRARFELVGVAYVGMWFGIAVP